MAAWTSRPLWSGKPDVEDEARGLVPQLLRQERLGRGERFRAEPHRAHEARDRSAHRLLVVDDVDDPVRAHGLVPRPRATTSGAPLGSALRSGRPERARGPSYREAGLPCLPFTAAAPAGRGRCCSGPPRRSSPVREPGESGADERRDPEEPELSDGPAAHDQRGPGASGRIDRGVRDRNADEMDQRQPESDGDRGESRGRPPVRRPEDDRSEHDR